MTVLASWIDVISGEPALAELAPDLLVARYVFIEVVEEPDLAVDLRLKLFFDPAVSRYTIEALEVRRRLAWASIQEAEPIDGTGLRSIRVKDYLRRGLAEKTSPIFIDRSSYREVWEFDDARARQVRNAGPSDDESLRWASRLYMRARALHQDPTVEVAEKLGIARPTASVWIRRARDRGLMPGADSIGAPMSLPEYRHVRKVLGIEDLAPEYSNNRTMIFGPPDPELTGDEGMEWLHSESD